MAQPTIRQTAASVALAGVLGAFGFGYILWLIGGWRALLAVFLMNSCIALVVLANSIIETDADVLVEEQVT